MTRFLMTSVKVAGLIVFLAVIGVGFWEYSLSRRPSAPTGAAGDMTMTCRNKSRSFPCTENEYTLLATAHGVFGVAMAGLVVLGIIDFVNRKTGKRG